MSLKGAVVEASAEDGFDTRVAGLIQRLILASESKDLKAQLQQAQDLSNSWQETLSSLAGVMGHRPGPDDFDSERLFSLLADASRDVSWRKAFGPTINANRLAPWTKCILGVGIDVIGDVEASDQVMTHALRLILNCCADEDSNRQYVVQRNGVSRMLALLHISRYADYAVPALYNVCIDFQDVSQNGEENAGNAQKTNAAERQLAAGRSADGRSSIETLIGLSASIQDDRKALLADLVEIASRPATENLKFLLECTDLKPVATEPQPKQEQLKMILKALTVSPGPSRLAAYSSECCVSICNALINILSQQDARIVLLTLDDFLSFLWLPYRFDETKVPYEYEDHDALDDLSQCRGMYLKLVYEITAMPEFEARYDIKSKQIQACIYDLGELTPISIYLCVVLANVTISVRTAEALVVEYGIHKAVISLLKTAGFSILPAISLLVKLSLPDANKTILAKSGVFDSLSQLLKIQTSADVQREAIVAARLLLKGKPDNVALASTQTSTHEPTGGRSSLFVAVLESFTHTEDESIKLEIGRLLIEVCRTVFKEEDANEQLDRAIRGDPAAAEAMAFVAQRGHDGLRSEGWFGLAMMSVLPEGQVVVVSCLKDAHLLDEMRKVAATKQGPSFENLKLMLAKLQPLQSQLSDRIRLAVEAASFDAGLVND